MKTNRGTPEDIEQRFALVREEMRRIRKGFPMYVWEIGRVLCEQRQGKLHV